MSSSLQRTTKHQTHKGLGEDLVWGSPGVGVIETDPVSKLGEGERLEIVVLSRGKCGSVRRFKTDVLIQLLCMAERLRPRR